MNRPRWLDRFASRRDAVRFVHCPPVAAAGHHRIHIYRRDGAEIGAVDWQVCHTCRRGAIIKIAVDPDWQRRGFGRRLVARALRDGPGYTWATSGQSPDARLLFECITAETGVAFTERGSPCSHIRAVRGPVFRRPVVDRSV